MRRIIQLSLLIVLEINTFNSYAMESSKEFIVVVASYNNKNWYKKNLDSILTQDYSSFRVIYVNDCSSDGTETLVADYIKESHAENKVTLINKKRRQGALASYYHAIHECADDAIIILVDGDDWLFDKHVISRLNNAYENEQTWLTYGSYIEYPSLTKGAPCEQTHNVIEHQWQREDEWLTPHLITFYASLFKRIRLADLLYHGEFFKIGHRFAIMFPLFEMAGEHALFIPETLYVYNTANPLQVKKLYPLTNMRYEKIIRAQDKYPPLQKKPPITYTTPYAHALIFSESTHTLAALLDSLAAYAPGLTQYTVLYTSTNKIAYEELCARYNAQCIPYNECDDLARIVLDQLAQCTQEFVLLTRDQYKLTERLNIPACIHALQTTHAYGFYGTLSTQDIIVPGLTHPAHLPPIIELNNSFYAWQFSSGEYTWRFPPPFALAIYRRTDCQSMLSELVAHDVATIEVAWNGIPINENSIGLCLQQSRSSQQSTRPLERNTGSAI